MGNIATKAFESPIPLPLVKSVEILGTADDTTMAQLKINLSLQSIAKEDGRPFGLFVALINDESVVNNLKDKESALRYEIANQNSPATKSSMIKKYIGIEDFVTDGTIKHVTNKDTGAGVVTREVPINVDIYLTEEQDLWLYCVAYELDSESSDLNKAAIPRSKRFQVSSPVIETIMTRGKASSTTYLFTLAASSEEVGERGDVWPGPVHRQGADYYAGQRPGEGGRSPKLIRTLVSNQKVRDLRLLKAVESLNLNNFVSNAENVNKTNRRNFERFRQTVGKRYFSRLHYSRTTSGEFKLWLAMDYDAFINDHCRLANVFTNKASLRSCYSVSNITVFRHKRSRPDEGSKLASQLTAEDQSKTFESPVAIADLQKGNIVPFDTANDNFVNFLINDTKMKENEINIYEYTLNFEFVDHTAVAISNVVQGLQSCLTEFQAFMSNFEGLGKKNFDIEEYLRVNAKVIKSDDSWLKLINEFLSSIWFLFGQDGFGEQSAEVWKKNLITMINPMSATESSMQRFVEVIKGYVNDLDYLISASPTGRSEAKFNARSTLGTTQNLIKRIEYTHIPRRVLKNTENSVGFDYLGAGTLSSEPAHGFPTISSEAFITRINRELNKYGVGNPNVPEINKFGFLSPYNIYTPYEVQSVGRSGLELSDGLVMLDNNVNPGINLFASDGAVADLDVKLAKMQGIQGSAGITMQPLRENLGSFVDSRKRPAIDQKTSPALDYFAPSASAEIGPNESRISASSDSPISSLQFNRSLVRALEGPLSEKLLDGVSQDFRPPRPTRTTFIQGSLALARVVQNAVEFLNLNSFERDINYNSLRRVEFLDGYERNDIRRPNWSTLSQGRLKEMEESGGTILCRLKRCPPMTSPGNSYELPPFNYLFTIGQDFLEKPQMVKPTFNMRQRSYHRRLQSLDKSPVININRPEADYGAEYYSSPGMVFATFIPPKPALTAVQIAQNEWDAKRKAWRGRGWNWRRSKADRRFVKLYGRRPTGLSEVGAEMDE